MISLILTLSFCRATSMDAITYRKQLRRQPEFLAEDVQHGVATDETHQVIAAFVGFGQRMLGCYGRIRQPNLGLPQCHLWRSSLQLGLAIARVMFRFKDQRFPIQVLGSLHRHAAQMTAAVIVINFSTTPLRQGSAIGINQSSTPWARQRRMRQPIPRGCRWLP